MIGGQTGLTYCYWLLLLLLMQKEKGWVGILKHFYLGDGRSQIYYLVCYSHLWMTIEQL